MKNWCISATVASLAFAVATTANAADIDTGWSLQTEPTVSIDYEGMISTKHSTPYVMFAHKDRPDDLNYLKWSDIKEMIENGKYGQFGEKVIREACEALVKDHEWLTQDASIPTTTYPPENYPCGQPKVLVPVS